MTAVEQALTEINARAEAIAPQHEGLRDLARLNLHQEAQKEVQVAIAQYDRRVSLMEALRSAAVQLLADGYPSLDVKQLPSAVLADLQDQVITITAALKQFSAPDEAIDLALVAGRPELK